MPTAPSHAIAAIALGAAFYKRGEAPTPLFGLAALCSALPDLDVIGFRLGIHYEDLLGHRGLTHSFAFAAVLAGAATPAWPARWRAGLGARAIWLYLFLATASHGLLDALTDGGLGIGFFSPFNPARYFFPVRPIHVAPIGLTGPLRPGILPVIGSEVVWVWLPAVAFAACLLAWRRPWRAGG